MTEYICKNGRIYGLEICEGEAYHDPDFLPKCDCGEVCKHASNSIRISKELLEVSLP